MKISSPKFKSKVEKVFLLTFGWVAGAAYISIIQYMSIILAMDNGMMAYDFTENFIITLVEVFLAGIILSSFEVFYFTDRFSKKSFGYAVIMKTIFYSLGLTFLTYLIFYFESFYYDQPYLEFLKRIAPNLLLNFIIYTPIFLISIFILQVSERFGQGVLLKFMLGKYHSPKLETRIFMFLDMKSSTSIAEALGNVRYFELLNELFYDVTDAIINSKGEIYQYVGDEIIISWNLKNGTEKLNSLNCFFEISQAIRDHSEKYQNKYGLVPSFKASIHYGEVTVGEVGVLKREITFSGDVLNTTARIQELCNKYNEKLLSSKNVLELFDTSPRYKIKEISQMNLRGRSEPVTIFSVRID